MHWATKYIGIPWVLGSSNIKVGFDCWSFFKYIQKKHFGLILPDIIMNQNSYLHKIKHFNSNDELNNWTKVEDRKNGDAILLKVAKYPNHIGIWLDSTGVQGILHTVENTGVIFNSKKSVYNNGWQIVSFYRHNSKI